MKKLVTMMTILTAGLVFTLLHDVESTTLEKADALIYETSREETILIPETVVVEKEPVLTPLESEVIFPEEDVALVTMAEAEGECEEGKRLVIDTILNRTDSPHFPDTVYDVVYQKGQFSSMWNGRVDRCCVQEDICQLVREEMLERTDPAVIFFTAGHYGRYGSPMYQVGNHYFSSYE